MKSIAIKDVKQFEMKEIPEPVSKNGEVVIEVSKCGICGSDLHYFEVGQPIGLVMGHEYCGRVIDKGDRDDLQIGDRVTALPISPCGKCSACFKGNPQYCLETWNHATGLSVDHPGGFAPKMAIRSDMVIKVPDTISDEEVAMVEPTAVGLHAIHLADIKVGDKVLVIGGGIIGLVSAMFAKKEGASFVVVSETNEGRGKKSVALGVSDAWLNVKDEQEIKEMQNKVGEGFDIVIDACGNSAAITSALTMVKTGGKVILAGVSLNPITIPSVLAVMHELTIQGAIAYTKEEFQTVIDLIAHKQIEVLQFLDEVVTLDQVQESFEKLMSGTTDTIKILVDLTR